MKHRIPPGGGAVPARPDGQMGAEHAESVGPWRGTWSKIMKRAATKRRRRHDREESEKQWP